MSWQAYIDSSMLGTGKVKAGAIIGLADGAIWAKSPNFKVRKVCVIALLQYDLL
jgi:profilin